MPTTAEIKVENRFMLQNYLTFHKALLNDITALTDRMSKYSSASNRDLQKMEQWFALHCYMINSHHRGEDEVQFPEYGRRDPDFTLEMQRLVADHHAIEALIAQINAGFAGLPALPAEQREAAYFEQTELVKSYGEAVRGHLKREEAAVIKSVKAHYNEEEQLKMQKTHLKGESFKHLSITAPWMVMNLNPQDRAELINKAPLILKLLFYLSWKRKYLKAMPVFDS